MHHKKIYQFNIKPIDEKINFNKKISTNYNKQDYSKIIVRKPWGYEYVIFQDNNVCVTILYINKGHQTSMHCHSRKKTSLIVLDGKVYCSNLEKKIILKTGENVQIEKKVFHQTKTINNDSIIMEIETPNMKHNLLRLKDNYGREKKGYEKSDKFSINTNNYNYISLESKRTYHNNTKKFGKSSITFVSIKNLSDFNNLSLNDADCLITILKGKIKINDTIFLIADTFHISTLINSNTVKLLDKELLIIVNKVNDNETKVSDLILDIFDNYNLNTFFAVTGDTNLHLIDSLGKNESFQYLMFNNEFNASYAALGYAKRYQVPSILLLSSGHSVIKALEATYASYVDSEPMIIISGQASSTQSTNKNLRQFGNKSVNIIDIVKKITKYSIAVKNINDIKFFIQKAIFLSMHNRPGPVWIDVPIDFLGKIIFEKNLKHFYFNKAQNEMKFQNISKKISKVYELINNSKKPVILIGYGVNYKRAKNKMMDLVNKLKIPILTSRRGSDLIHHNHKFYFGRPGVYGNRYSNFIIQKCDLFISIGSRLSIPLIGRNTVSFAKNAIKIVVDVDENELEKKTIKPDFPINFSADEFINQMINYKTSKIKKFEKWIKICKELKNQYSFSKEEYSNENKLLNPYLFTNKFSKYIPNFSTIVMDGGPIMNYVMQGFQIKSNQRLITSSGLDNEGFSFPASLGMVLSKENRLIICLCEEKSFLNSINDFSNINKYNIPIKIICYSGIENVALRGTQNDFFGKRFIGTYFDKYYKSFKNKILKNIGIKTIIIKNYKDISKICKKIFNNNQACFVLVKIDPNHHIKPKMGFSIDYSGIWKAKPLDDMYPFLKKKEL